MHLDQFQKSSLIPCSSSPVKHVFQGLKKMSIMLVMVVEYPKIYCLSSFFQHICEGEVEEFISFFPYATHLGGEDSCSLSKAPIFFSLFFFPFFHLQCNSFRFQNIAFVSWSRVGVGTKMSLWVQIHDIKDFSYVIESWQKILEMLRLEPKLIRCSSSLYVFHIKKNTKNNFHIYVG